MAVVRKVRNLLRQKKGDEAVSFLMTTAMLLLIFVVLVSAMVYIMQYYNASYACRRIVRSIEITGLYDETATRELLDSMIGSGMDNTDVQVDTEYFSGNKIQLRQTFSVTLTGSYRITVLQFGGSPIELSLPITVKVAGMSEVFWRE